MNNVTCLTPNLYFGPYPIKDSSILLDADALLL